MRPILIALFGAIITVPAIAIFTNGAAAILIWLATVFTSIDYVAVYLHVFWWANGAALIGAIPVFRHILVAERRLAHI